ncbi:hypothetical protein TELCIR_17880, partial [Teladorsagia circumcincta]
SQRPTKTLDIDKSIEATSRTSKWRAGNGGRSVALRFGHDQPAGQTQCSTAGRQLSPSQSTFPWL